ncbi:DUF547 domain-containing protein [Gemmatimonas sp.]|jgi:hypothetical protein|uniref:DUF547 domain-containing protein n=1 Tax=Gemmatimonas sp. TaxID=1962908 RepID=UPI0037BFDDC0
MRVATRFVRCLSAAVLLAASVASLPAQSPRDTALHAPFDRLLKTHVRAGLVDYDAFARAPEFPRYLASLDTVHVSALSEDERLAYWINVYNAYTIQLIVRHHERQSIRNINRTLGFLQLKGPWNEPIVKAGGQVYTLDQVLHRILRREFHESRVHFAIVPASKSAPPLRSEAYVGARLGEQLEDQTRRFLSDTTKTWYRNGVLGLNRLFEAYERDFGSSRKEMILFVAPYITFRPTEPQRKRLEEGRALLNYRQYDWSLNVRDKS